MTIPPDFPWRPGMRDVGDHNVPYSRVVEVWPNGFPRRWVNEGEDGDRYTVSADEAAEMWAGVLPDDTDGATVGALAQAVRGALGRPFLETYYGNGAFYIADFAPENEPYDDSSWPTMRTDGSFGLNQQPEVHGELRFAAWLAAWNARPKESR